MIDWIHYTSDDTGKAFRFSGTVWQTYCPNMDTWVTGSPGPDKITYAKDAHEAIHGKPQHVEPPVSDDLPKEGVSGHDVPPWLKEAFTPSLTQQQQLLAQFTAAALTGLMANTKLTYNDNCIDAAHAVRIARATLTAFNEEIQP